MPGTRTARAGRLLTSAIRSTWTITRPPEFLAAMAMARLSRVSASRSMEMLPAGSAVVPRISATWIGNVR